MIPMLIALRMDSKGWAVHYELYLRKVDSACLDPVLSSWEYWGPLLEAPFWSPMLAPWSSLGISRVCASNSFWSLDLEPSVRYRTFIQLGLDFSLTTSYTKPSLKMTFTIDHQDWNRNLNGRVRIPFSFWIGIESNKIRIILHSSFLKRWTLL